MTMYEETYGYDPHDLINPTSSKAKTGREIYDELEATKKARTHGRSAGDLGTLDREFFLNTTNRNLPNYSPEEKAIYREWMASLPVKESFPSVGGLPIRDTKTEIFIPHPNVAENKVAITPAIEFVDAVGKGLTRAKKDFTPATTPIGDQAPTTPPTGPPTGPTAWDFDDPTLSPMDQRPVEDTRSFPSAIPGAQFANVPVPGAAIATTAGPIQEKINQVSATFDGTETLAQQEFLRGIQNFMNIGGTGLLPELPAPRYGIDIDADTQQYTPNYQAMHDLYAAAMDVSKNFELAKINQVNPANIYADAQKYEVDAYVASQDYKTHADYWSAYNTVQGNKDIANAANASEQEIAQITSDAETLIAERNNYSNEYMARLNLWAMQTDATSRENVAREQGWTATEIAKIEGDTQRYLADKNYYIAEATGLTQQIVAGIQKKSAIAVAEKQYQTQREVASINAASANEIARISGENAGAVQKLISDAEIEVAARNNTTAEKIANINSGLQSLVAAEQRLTDVQIAEIQKQMHIAVAEKTGLTEGQVATTYATAQTTVAEQELKIAEEQGATAEQVATTRAEADKAIAITTGNAQEAVATTRKESELAVAKENGLSTSAVATIHAGAQTSVAETQKLGAEEVADIQKQMNISIAEKTGLTEQAVATTYANAQTTVATTQAQAQRDVAEEQAQAQIDIGERQAEAQELAARGGLTAEQRLAEIEATGAAQAAAQGVLTPEQRLAEMAAQGLIEQAVARGGLTAEQRLAELQQQADIAGLQARGGLTGEQRLEEAGLVARGGLSPEQRLAEMTAQQGALALQARGGLSPEQRLAEIQAEQQGQNLATILTLLSNPQALGALVGLGLPMTQGQGFVSGATTEGVPAGLAQLFGGQGIPTMAQASQFTPAIANLLTGLAASQGVQPTTLGQLIQSVTPLGGGTASTFVPTG